MFAALGNWFDDRTGYREIVHDALYENIPGGSRWRYVWGSTLVFTFAVQLITGVFLWMCYSPSVQTAWESVFYIQHEMQGGWLLRGLHHFTAQAMVILLLFHLMQVVIDGAYRAPREINFWLGLILLQIVLGLSLTGYLLPWDQKGYWATRVSTEIAGTAPVAGGIIQKMAVGGDEYGHHTLTRFFALHAGVLPGTLIAFLALHIYLFRRHGLKHKLSDRPPQMFWPDQALKDAVACLAVLAAILAAVHFLGADLGAPADPANEYSAARPEWYFLFLFQFLKYFPGEKEVIGAIYIPGAVMFVLAMMPIVGKWKLGHGFNVAFLFALIAGAGFLTTMAYREDLSDQNYNNAVWEAHQYALAAEARAKQGIPVEGAARMMRTNVSKHAYAISIITQECLSCHSYLDEKGRGFKPQELSAPNLYGFASRSWIEGILDPTKVDGDHYFGPTAFGKKQDGTGMVEWVKTTGGKLESVDKEAIAVALSAEAALPSQRELDKQHAEIVTRGRDLIKNKAGCSDCHQFHDAGALGSAPDLTGYGSREWLMGMIADPNHERFYGHATAAGQQKMPAFAGRLDPEIIGLIADWLRGDWYAPPAPPPETQPAETNTPPPAANRGAGN